MLRLIVPEKNETVSRWEDQINEMAVGYQIEVDEKAPQPEIEHCREHYRGDEAISKYLVELTKFMESWRKCSCEQ